MLPRLNSSAKVALGFAAVFLLGIIAIACAFFYEFLQEYKTELNHALFYGLVFFGCLLLFTSAAIAVYAVAMLALHYQTKRLYTQEKQQTLQAITTQNLLFQVTAKQIETGRVYLSEQRTEQGVVKFKSLPKPSKQQATEPALSLPELDSPAEPGNTLLNDISDCQRLLIVGGSGTGKTSLLLHIAQQRQVLGDLIILDSNGKKGKWGAYRVIGLGYDHQAIKDELLRLNEILKTRFNEYAFGNIEEREHPLITIIADEWHIISTEIKEFARFLPKAEN